MGELVYSMSEYNRAVVLHVLYFMLSMPTLEKEMLQLKDFIPHMNEYTVLVKCNLHPLRAEQVC